MIGPLMIDIADTTLNAEDKTLLQKTEVGGIILFARNVASPTQVRELCDSIRQIQPNIIIGIDQEGGRVARLRDGFTPLPAMGKLGDVFDSEPVKALGLAYDCGYLMATEVLAVGVDLSFAPVLDINGVSQVIGDRSFHTSTEAIVALSTQFMHGMQAAGMATTAKHFPGHGSIAPDSHVADAVDSRTFDEIWRSDLQPFIQCLPWLDAMMPAHVIFNQIDNKPAGFSKVWLQDIARDKMGFKGVLFSDDLSMKAAHVAGGVEKRVAAALDAGCDMALVCNDRSAALQAVEYLNLNSSKSDTHNTTNRKLTQIQSIIPPWQGSFENTCAQFSYWSQARESILNEFFSTSCEHSITDDPTEYAK